MGTINSDKSWKAYGKKNPYFGVLTHEEYLDENLTDESKAKFFETGEKYVNQVQQIIQEKIDSNFSAKSILDFGCGTGRLALAFAKTGVHTTGVDVSEDMIAEVKRNAEKFNIPNTSFCTSDDQLSTLGKEKFDLINSYIVFQHINTERGLNIFSSLVDRLNVRGVGIIQFSYSADKGKLNRAADYIRYRVPLVHQFINILKGREWNEPLMQMNSYDLNTIYNILQNKNITNTFQQLENHGGYLGVTIFFQK